MVVGPLAPEMAVLIPEMPEEGDRLTIVAVPAGKAVPQLHCAFELSVIAMIKKITKKMTNKIFLVFILVWIKCLSTEAWAKAEFRKQRKGCLKGLAILKIIFCSILI